MHSLVTPPFPQVEDLSLREQIAQMIVVRASGHLFDHQIQYPSWEPPAHHLKRWVSELGVGGVILLGGSAAEIGVRTQQLQSWSSIPLLLTADIEEGVGQRFAGATWFPPPMAIAQIAQQDLSKAIHYTTQMGAATAQEAIAIGLNWILAPVVDVNNNPNNPVINVRAFGDVPDIVGQLGTAFIQGVHQHPVLTAAKHFPGHGDTATDSHLVLPTIPHSLARLHSVEMVPFEAAIAAGVDSVMSAHLLIPALDPNYPATLSTAILTELLRKDLGFEGLIVTDALVMGAIANHFGKNEATVMAVQAGADILLMPLDVEGAIDAIETAVESGQISSERIQNSVERIWCAKQQVATPFMQDKIGEHHSHAWEILPPQPIDISHLSTRETSACAEAILQDSMTISVSHPLSSVNSGLNILLLDDGLNAGYVGHHTAAIATPCYYGFRTLLVIDYHTPLDSYSFLRDTKEPIVLQVFVRGNPFRGSAGLSGTPQLYLDSLFGGGSNTSQSSPNIKAVVVYGSPYMAKHIQTNCVETMPFVFTYGQMPMAQKLAMEHLFGASQQFIPHNA